MTTRREFLGVVTGGAFRPAEGRVFEIRADALEDKIRGGFLGQLLGDLNGLKHEMKYIAEPGSVESYTPALPDGAWTDDDTDFEWVYVVEMERSGVLFIPPRRISELWKAHINRRIWCSNQYARQLMGLGIDPPLTGRIALNPWADFNISGQFLSESFGLMCPALPRTAGRLGLHYTHVGIEGEPAQATQLVTAMIATAFTTDSIEEIIAAGLAAVDPASVIRRVVNDVRAWHRENPADWRTTRRLVKERYTQFDGAQRDRNGHELNTASLVAALLYGGGDFVKTAIAAFNFGWDADNNAATACTVVGVLKGWRWMMSQGWTIGDRYRNTSRDRMPEDETIEKFAGRIVALSDRVIREHGGSKNGGVYRIPREEPGNVEALPDPRREFAALQRRFRSEVGNAIMGNATDQQRARAAYLAICLDLALPLRQKRPKEWERALAALNGFRNVVQVLYFHADIPAGDRLRARAAAAGLAEPAEKLKIW
jgi:ADP-ribosylglycohydrolase